jgi:glycerophosphoryl diester phosphodiesterase
MKKILSLLFSILFSLWLFSRRFRKSKKKERHPFHQGKQFRIIAHRGGMAEAPENTMLAFQKAYKAGVKAFELDIHMTADGVIVVHHDKTVDRSTDGSGLIREMTFAELQKLDASASFAKEYGKAIGEKASIPTLEELFQAFADCSFHIDIKDHRPEACEAFANLIRKYRMQNKILVGSFDRKTMRHFARLCPQAAHSATYDEVRRFFLLSHLWLDIFCNLERDALQIPTYSGPIPLLTPWLVKACQKHGLLLYVWVINDIKDARYYKEQGVDGIITDLPAAFLTSDL